MRTRTLTLPALAGAGLLLLAGCASDGEAPETSESTASESADPSASAAPVPSEITPGATAEDLAGTSWFGTAEGVAEVTFTLNADGTVDFESFNGQPFDAPTDVWSVDGETFSLTISQLQAPTGEVVDIVFTGTAATGGMELVGDDGAGTQYPMTIAQV
ncbi:hypothetical protein [Agrococcus jejuensis]|uniref:Uncharacterized protein n=1 Tax=Agrococcus jejuensis TaxID=399736 RepID=A0A1G8D1G2_9MICO|nr:hypothetical protein [Agrococcus jejuensis]SDH51522.1 hypothetical protein SAMN04489720_1482 [Agrococcus jejuensis]